MLEWFLQHWSEIAFSVIVPWLVYLYKILHAYRQGLLALMRHLIIEYYNTYMEREYIPIYAMENVTSIYRAYHTLGGNGTCTKLYEELLHLPSVKPDEEEQHCEKECGNTCLKICREHQPDQIL